ncbi:MAG TPA: ATP-binding protein [Marmoricola sp.]|nr:ATP-binding protein [Marmoricola sp.]
MWSTPGRRLPLAGQLLLLQLAVLAVVLAVVGVISVQQSTRAFEEERGSQLRSVAEYVATLPVVRSGLRGPQPATALAPPVSRALALSAADRVSVTGPDGTILASSDSGTNGEPAQLGASDALEGRGWSGQVDTPRGGILAAHAPVLDAEGDVLGLAVAEADYPSVRERLTLAAPDLVLYLGLGALLGVAGSVLLFRMVWRRTRGLRSSEIATLADHREALLVSIGEGVLAVGTDGRVTTANDSARELLALPDDVVGRHVSELGLADPVETLLLSDEESHDAVLVVGEQVLVFNQRAAASRGEGIGAVTTMRDRTELVSMQSQLSSNLSLTDTLRAQTHEFANKLHTISGLVQLEEYDEVVTLIGELTRRSQELSRHVSDRVADLPLAALVIAKASVADEAGVELEITDGTSLGVLPADVSADLVTVVGNLVDNALDACRGGARPSVRPQVRLELRSEADQVTVEVSDNGPGVPDELRGSIFVRGFSTKDHVAEGRGIGLALVQLICGQRGGSVVTTREGDETVFRVVLPLPSPVAGGVR